jgi:hypothetical protein
LAQITKVTLIDDLDGGRADETVVFSLDRVTYEIDLSKAHADRLRAVVARFAAVARRVPRWRVDPAGAARTPRTSRGKDWPVRRPAQLTPEDTRRIREYASRRGILVHPRGRLPNHVVNAYYRQFDG